MKALSIHPESTFDIFMGVKTCEERTWQTDYRGELLICASSKKTTGFVCGYAWFVVPLLDIKPSEKAWVDESGKRVTMYEWALGKPKAIKPIPVKGKLHLFDVDDALIEYVEGGDLAACPDDEAAEAFRTGFIRQYLDPLAYHTKNSGSGVTIFSLQRELDRRLSQCRTWDERFIGLAFLREPF